ncbi:MAG TPA: DUF998 domain-containing protein [Propionibacteriaceae bacterium]
MTIIETRSRTETATRAMLACGLVAGPLFVATVIVQILTRDGFDLRRHPISLLSVGEHGWIQVTNFILAGVLSIIFSIGVARVLADGPGSRWAPRFFALFGVGLVIGGIFRADPALGFPAGAPEGYPEHITTHGMIHAFAPPLSFLALIAACLVIARCFAADGLRRAALLTRIVAALCFVLSVPVGPGFSIRLFVAVALAFGWVAGYALYLLHRITA